ncbi:MAG: GDP-mannose 4,6-dehydratase [Anaerolineae bacterium]|nr:GDP-mannose 4,6-dehydratase [Anaerolineae bacterium]
MRILITGAGGFVGQHLIHHLRTCYPQAELHGTVLEPASSQDDTTVWHALDLKNESAVQAMLAAVQPDQIYHLAAQSSPRRSFSIPWETLENNIRLQLNIILGCLALQQSPRLLVISSAEIYGPTRISKQPISEDAPLQPANPYGVSKVAQDLLALQYFLSHKLPIIRVRPFNHFGPGQSEGFVATDFAVQVARIEASQQPPVMEVGNLTGQRDFTDVRDIVRAYQLIMEKGIPGEVYNIASGKTHSIQSLLDTLLRLSSVEIQVRTDPARMLPIDIPVIQGDAARLRQITGWEPTIDFETTLLDILNDWRIRVRLTKRITS